MLGDSVDPDQIALEHSDQGLHRLPVILLNVNNTLVQKRKVNVQVFPSIKGNLKTTLSRCLLSEKCMLFLCTRLIQDTCTLHQRKYRYVGQITIKVLNIGADKIRLLRTMSSLIRVYIVLLFHLHLLQVYAFTAVKKKDDV